jgi:hypothetical protein
MTTNVTDRRARWARRAELPNYVAARQALEHHEALARVSLSIRSRTGWSQADLARCLGVDLREVQRIESGRQAVPRPIVRQLARVARAVAGSPGGVTVSQAPPLYPSQSPMLHGSAPWARQRSTI